MKYVLAFKHKDEFGQEMFLFEAQDGYGWVPFVHITYESLDAAREATQRYDTDIYIFEEPDARTIAEGNAAILLREVRYGDKKHLDRIH